MSEINVQANPLPGESSLCGLQMATFSLSSYSLSSLCACAWKESVSSGISSLRTLILSDQGPNFMTSFNLITPLEAPSPSTASLGSGLHHRDSDGHKHSVHHTVCHSAPAPQAKLILKQNAFPIFTLGTERHVYLLTGGSNFSQASGVY